MTLDLLYTEWFFMQSCEYVVVEWNWGIRVNLLSSGLYLRMIPVGILYWSLSAFDCRSVSLGGVSRSGLGPYPRYMSSSLAPECIEVRVEKRLKLTPK